MPRFTEVRRTGHKHQAWRSNPSVWLQSPLCSRIGSVFPNLKIFLNFFDQVIPFWPFKHLQEHSWRYLFRKWYVRWPVKIGLLSKRDRCIFFSWNELIVCKHFQGVHLRGVLQKLCLQYFGKIADVTEWIIEHFTFFDLIWARGHQVWQWIFGFFGIFSSFSFWVVVKMVDRVNDNSQ